MKKYLLLILLAIASTAMQGQELNATVQVSAPTITGVDKRVFESMKSAITGFLNDRKWTEDIFLNQERIECTFNIIFQTNPSTGYFMGTIQVQSRRPVYGSSYNSPLFNYLDADFNVNFQEGTPLDYNDQTDMSNLTSILAYYAYLVVGLDYDSFSMNGGGIYLNKAQNIVNFCQNESEKGWKSYEGTKNRYWYMDNLLNPLFKDVRVANYRMHRLGLDIMSDKPDDGRKAITNCMELVYNAYKNQPGMLLFKVYFDTKGDELVNIFSQGAPDEKTKVVPWFNEMDPSNANKYAKITNGK